MFLLAILAVHYLFCKRLFLYSPFFDECRLTGAKHNLNNNKNCIINAHNCILHLLVYFIFFFFVFLSFWCGLCAKSVFFFYDLFLNEFFFNVILWTCDYYDWSRLLVERKKTKSLNRKIFFSDVNIRGSVTKKDNCRRILADAVYTSELVKTTFCHWFDDISLLDTDRCGWLLI